MKKILFIFLLLGFLSQNSVLFSQFHSEYFSSAIESPVDSSKLSLTINASGFFHNNEFFSTDVEGYTLTGNYIQPFIQYSIAENLSIGAGAHLLKYNGQEGFNQKLPLLNIRYQASENFTILLGSYNGGDNFKLPEMLYARELQFTKLVNNGVSIKYNNERIRVQTWLDWERFIEAGDFFREEFSFGTSAHYSVINNEQTELSIPLYLMANHKGGQINSNNQPVETIADLSSGLEYSMKLNMRLIEKVKFEGLFFLEKDIESLEDGNAFKIQATGTNKFAQASLGYFHANNWESVHGNPLLFCGDFNSTDTKNMILIKTGIAKNITKHSAFSLRFEGYYDLDSQRLQYIYGIYLNVREVVGY